MIFWPFYPLLILEHNIGLTNYGVLQPIFQARATFRHGSRKKPRSVPAVQYM
jgi:hypothetical protein